MKKIMSIMLGLSLIVGTAALVAAPQEKEPEKGGKKGKGKKGGDKDKDKDKDKAHRSTSSN